MKIKSFFLLVLGSLLLVAPQTAFAVENMQADVTSPSTALCLPGVYTTAPDDCQPLGPSDYLSRMAENNLRFPLQEIPAHAPDESLAELPYYYAKVRSKVVSLYHSAEDAFADVTPKRYLELGLNYITYVDWREIDGKYFYMLAPGEWVKGADVKLNIVSSTFAGLEFSGTPERKVGWILFPLETQTEPGYYEPDFTGYQYARFETIQVYETREVDGVDWHMIMPDQWVEARFTALVYPAAEAPAGVENGRWIEINLFEQTISVYQDNRLVFATMTSTGVDAWWTRPGLFQVYEKHESTLMTGAFEADRADFYYLEDVPWTMYFDEARAFHGAYWHNKFGYENSHGCANLSPGDSQWLFDWALLGDWVYVWDPSGKTPIDPSLYGAGGA